MHLLIIFVSQNSKGRIQNDPNGYILKDMAKGPLRYAKSYNICYVNDYKFHTNKHSTRKAMDNSGVCVKAEEDSLDRDDFYGRLEEIIELDHPGMPIKRVTMFKYQWFDPTRSRRGAGTRVHERYQIVDVHIGRSWGKYDPFVLASQASQVYYRILI